MILFVAGSPRLAGRFAKHQNWMRFIGAVHVGVDRIRREPRRALSVLVAAIIYQVSVLIAVYCAIHALGVSVPNGAVLAFLPAVATAQVLPISLSGLGIREGLLVLLLHPLGVPTGKAIGIGLLWYGMTLVVSLLGAPAFAVGHRTRRLDAGDSRRHRTTATHARRHERRRTEDEPTPPSSVPLHRRLPGGRTLRDGRRLYWWGEIIAVLAFYFVYSFVRNLHHGNPHEALRARARHHPAGRSRSGSTTSRRSRRGRSARAPSSSPPTTSTARCTSSSPSA